MIIKRFESFNEPEWREVGQNEWIEFGKTHKSLPMDSNDLKRFEPLRLKSRVNVGEKYSNIHLNNSAARIEKFEDEWWTVSVVILITKKEVEATAGRLIKFYICDGIDSMLDLIYRVNKGEF
jgi:hypothetical protein